MLLTNKFQLIEEKENFNSIDSNSDISEGLNISSPFIIRLRNLTSRAVTSFDFLDALKNATATNYGLPLTSTRTPAIQAFCMLAGWDYGMFLEYLKTNAMVIGKISTISGSANTEDLDNPFKITWYNGQGKEKSETVFPENNLLNKKQNQIDSLVEFPLQQTTKISIIEIKALSSLSFKFYPMEMASSLFGLGKKSINQNIVNNTGINNIN